MACDAHLKGKRHLLNEPDNFTKVCEKCNIEFRALNYSKHLTSENHLENDSDRIVKPVKPKKLNMPTRLCKKCKVEIEFTQTNSWHIHVMSKTLLENKPDSCKKKTMRKMQYRSKIAKLV